MAVDIRIQRETVVCKRQMPGIDGHRKIRAAALLTLTSQSTSKLCAAISSHSSILRRRSLGCLNETAHSSPAPGASAFKDQITVLLRSEVVCDGNSVTAMPAPHRLQYPFLGGRWDRAPKQLGLKAELFCTHGSFVFRSILAGSGDYRLATLFADARKNSGKSLSNRRSSSVIDLSIGC